MSNLLSLALILFGAACLRLSGSPSGALRGFDARNAGAGREARA